MTLNNYDKKGYSHSFDQLIMIDGENHRVHAYDARLAWNFMGPFSRMKNGQLIERKRKCLNKQDRT